MNVYTPLTVPNAFTPNGDGHNDVFYVLAGPEGIRISELNVYDRWGQCVFRNKGVRPAIHTTGGTALIKVSPLPPALMSILP